MHLHRYGAPRLHWMGVTVLMSIQSCRHKNCRKVRVRWVR